MPKWTSAQQNAIDARDCNILVSAAAGSGKTAVLSERVIKLITDESLNVDVDKLLIVTFTNAAAAEMKNRISKKLFDILKEQANNTNARRQLSLLPNANVCTIDSFCIKLVRDNFFSLGIEQDFRILDTSEELILEKTAMEELLDELYEEDATGFKELVDMFSNTKNDNGFANIISKISHFISSQAFPERWLDERCELYNPNIKLKDSFCAEYVVSEAKELLGIITDLISQSRQALDSTDKNYGKLLDNIDSDSSIINSLIENACINNWDKEVEIINNISFATFPRCNCGGKSVVKANRDLYKSIISKAIAPLFCVTTSEYLEDCKTLYPAIKQLADIVKHFNQKTADMKKEINSYTFSDVEHFAIKLLFCEDENGAIVRTDLAMELQNSFYEILVDEYQDTNDAQDKLFEALSNGKNRFMVGDIKQSIYKFRHAMPFIFNQKKDSYTSYKEKSGAFSQKIDLSNNFRSRKGVCDYINFVCSHIMSKKIGGIEYDSAEMLNASAEFVDTDVPCAQIEYVVTPDGADKLEYETHQIANYILNKIKNKEQIKIGDNEYRDICYGDFAILLRSAKDSMSVITKVLSQHGIPSVANNKVNLFDNQEIVILLNLLRTIDNPTQDIPLLATLMSVFYGYTADDISQARVDYRGGNLYSSVSSEPTFSNFVEDLKKYRKYASSMSVENLVRQIISDTSYLSVISALGNHEQRVQNVMLLIDIAKRFDNGENVGLTAFIRYVDSIIENGYNVDSASVNDICKDAVNVMTIHHSKGLEFPVCILADASHQYNKNELKDSVMLNPLYGIGLTVFDADNLCRYKSLQYSVLKDLNTYDLMSENLRVLYVAMTRAKEQFVTFISVSSKGVGNYADNLSKNLISSCSSTASQIPSFVVKSAADDATLISLSAIIHKDGRILRDTCSKNDIGFDVYADFPLDIQIIEESADSFIEKETPALCNLELKKEIEQKLRFEYSRLSLSAFSSKRTASSLDAPEQDFKFLTSSKPAFLSKTKMTSAQKGTAMHTFMQFCDYSSSKQNLENEIGRLQSLSFITNEQADCLDRERLAALFDSEFAQRMFNSDNIYREIKVSSFVPVNMVEDTDYTDEVLVQGIADCVFEENGELVLVDYKTDKVENEQELLDRYKNQISFYINAVSKTLEKPVKEAVLYSFSLNKVCIYK